MAMRKDDTESYDAKRLESLVREVGEVFGYENLDVEIGPSFDATLGVTQICGYSKIEEHTERVKVKLGLSKRLKPGEVEFVVAHEFADYEYSKKHPKFHKISKMGIMPPIFLITLGLSSFITLLYETLADNEARKRGIKIPYWFHFS